MSLSRANAEFMIVAEVSPLLTAAGMAVTVAGSNASLNRPIGQAILDLGYAVASIILVADADVALVVDAKIGEFVDLCVLHTLEAILGHLDDVDLQVGPRTEKLSQLAEQVENKAERLRKRIERLYGYGLAVPEAGYITRSFAEHG